MQLDLFKPSPAIQGDKTVGGVNIWYCPRRLVWTTDPKEVGMSDDEVRAYREASFDAVFGPPEEWK